MRAIFRIAWWGIAGATLLFFVLNVAVQTPFVSSLLKKNAEWLLTYATHTQIRIGSVAGNWLTGVVLRDVTATHPQTQATLADLPAVTLSVLPRLGAIFPRITVHGGTLTIECYPPSTGSPFASDQKILPFTIHLQQLAGTVASCGWGPTSGTVAPAFDNLSGTIAVRATKPIIIDVSATPEDSRSPLHLSGTASPRGIAIDFAVNDLDPTRWSAYMIPYVTIDDGRWNLSGHIASTDPSTGAPSVLVRIAADITESTVSMPDLPHPITGVTGRVELTHTPGDLQIRLNGLQGTHRHCPVSVSGTLSPIHQRLSLTVTANHLTQLDNTPFFKKVFPTIDAGMTLRIAGDFATLGVTGDVAITHDTTPLASIHIEKNGPHYALTPAPQSPVRIQGIYHPNAFLHVEADPLPLDSWETHLSVAIHHRIPEQSGTVTLTTPSTPNALPIRGGRGQYQLDSNYHLSSRATIDLANGTALRVTAIGSDDHIAATLNSRVISGTLRIADRRISQAALTFIDTPLSWLPVVIGPHSVSYLLQGRLNGDFIYNHSPSTGQFRGQANNVSTAWGYLGDLAINASQTPMGVTIHELQATGVHNAQFTGLIRPDLQATVAVDGTFRMNALRYFADRGLRGNATLKGRVDKRPDGIQFDGRLQTPTLGVHGSTLTNVVIDGNVSHDLWDIRQFSATLNDGSVSGAGRLSPATLGAPPYQFQAKVTALSLHDVANLYQDLTQSFQKNTPFPGAKPFTQAYEYHQYAPNNLAEFNRIRSYTADAPSPLSIAGLLTGTIRMHPNESPQMEMQLRDFRYNDVSIAMTRIASIDPTHQTIDFYNIRHNHRVIDQVSAVINADHPVWMIDQTHIRYNSQSIHAPLTLRYDAKKDHVSGRIELKNNAIDLISLVHPAIQSIQNTGVLSIDFSGPLSNISLPQTVIELKNAVMVTGTKKNPTTWQIHHFAAQTSDGRISGPLSLTWNGTQTFRRVTRKKKTNVFNVSGTLGLADLNIRDQRATVSVNAQMPYAFFTIYQPDRYAGDIIAETLQLTGDYSWGGPPSSLTLSGAFQLRDGLITIPRQTATQKSSPIFLNMTATLGEGLFIEGSIIGEDTYNLATRVFLEVDGRASNPPLTITGSVTSPLANGTVYLHGGSATILDGVYTLMTTDQQSHYLQELLLVADNRIDLSPMDTTVHLRALRIKPKPNPPDDRDYPYPAVGLVIDGGIRNTPPSIRVLDLHLRDNYTPLSPYVFRGMYALGDAAATGADTPEMTLIVPDALANPSNSSFVRAGQDRINTFVQQSLRPYERRIAKRIGLYDFRLAYDWGRALIPADDQSLVDTTRIMGLEFVSNVYRERVFLNGLMNVNLSSDSVNTRSVSLKQMDLVVLLNDRLRFGLKGLNEDADITLVDPRWWISYGYSF